MLCATNKILTTMSNVLDSLLHYDSDGYECVVEDMDNGVHTQEEDARISTEERRRRILNDAKSRVIKAERALKIAILQQTYVRKKNDLDGALANLRRWEHDPGYAVDGTNCDVFRAHRLKKEEEHVQSLLDDIVDIEEQILDLDEEEL